MKTAMIFSIIFILCLGCFIVISILTTDYDEKDNNDNQK